MNWEGINMAISCSKRIDYLQNQCRELGLTVTMSGRKLMKDDYVIALRNYFIKKQFESIDKIPWCLKFMLSIESPQLCRRIKDLKPEQQKLVWESCDWIAEPKIDGCRMLILWDSSEKKFHFYSRNNSITDYLPQDYSDTIYVTSKNFDYNKNFVLDCEVISTNPKVESNTLCLTQLQSTAALLLLEPESSIPIQKKNPLKFIIFDCLYDGENLINKPWAIRHSHAASLTKLLIDHKFCCELNKVIENTNNNLYAKRDFFEEYIAQSGEGVVLKNKNAVYHATSSRTIDCVKVKRSTADTITKDLDAFVTDFVIGKDDTRNANMVVGFVFSIQMIKDDGTEVTHHIATCSNVSDFVKEDATVIDKDGTVTLNPDYYGRVATIQGQNVSARNLRLTHAIIDQWRFDKNINGCEKIRESELRSLVF
jgi:ATP-dependent DNA ligase